LSAAAPALLLLSLLVFNHGDTGDTEHARSILIKEFRAPLSTQKPGTTRPARTTAAQPSFDDLAKKAAAARDANRVEEALTLYARAVKMKPSWTEGHFHLGTAAYELDRHDQARTAFATVVRHSPEHGTAWTLKGLCEFRLKNYDAALSDLLKGRSLGIGGTRDLVGVARYHTAILLTRVEQYEHGLQVLNDFALEGQDAPGVIEAVGIATLRLPMLPQELPGGKRDMVMMAGRAGYFMASRNMAAAKNAFEALAARYPETPHVNYAYGVFLLSEEPDQAIEAFKRELAHSPTHVWAKLQIAFELIRRGDFAAARPWSEQAVGDAPNVFVARKALGQVLLETGDVPGAIRELESGVRMAPDSPALRFTLARAYRRAGRVADAEREQAEFSRLDRIVRASRSGVQSVGGIELDTPRERP